MFTVHMPVYALTAVLVYKINIHIFQVEVVVEVEEVGEVVC